MFEFISFIPIKTHCNDFQNFLNEKKTEDFPRFHILVMCSVDPSRDLKNNFSLDSQ